MASETGSQKARCTHCREDVSVPDSYAQGDHVKCGSCGTKHKVVRGDRLRLVIADVGPLRDALTQNQRLVDRLEADLSHARASLGDVLRQEHRQVPRAGRSLDAGVRLPPARRFLPHRVR